MAGGVGLGGGLLGVVGRAGWYLQIFPSESIFAGKHLIQFLVLKMKYFRNFVLRNCILFFYAEQVYLMLQVTNLKNKEVTIVQ